MFFFGLRVLGFVYFFMLWFIYLFIDIFIDLFLIFCICSFRFIYLFFASCSKEPTMSYFLVQFSSFPFIFELLAFLFFCWFGIHTASMPTTARTSTGGGAVLGKPEGSPSRRQSHNSCHMFVCMGWCCRPNLSSVHSHLFFKITGFYRPVKRFLKVN